MQHISSVDNLEALKLKLKEVVVRDLVNGKRVVEIFKVKNGKFKNKSLYILHELKGYAFMKDLANHGNGEYAVYKIFKATKNEFRLINSL